MKQQHPSSLHQKVATNETSPYKTKRYREGDYIVLFKDGHVIACATSWTDRRSRLTEFRKRWPTSTGWIRWWRYMPPGSAWPPGSSKYGRRSRLDPLKAAAARERLKDPSRVKKWRGGLCGACGRHGVTKDLTHCQYCRRACTAMKVKGMYLMVDKPE